MKCVDTFKTREVAQEARVKLREKGIESRVLVDTLDGRYGGLSEFDGVALMVDDDTFGAAQAILQGPSYRRAS